MHIQKYIKIFLLKKQMYNSEVFPNEEGRTEEERQEKNEDKIKEKEENSLNLVEYKPSIFNRVWS